MNTADLGKVRDRFAAVPWRMPNAVQLFVMDQEESSFRVWMLRNGTLAEVPMPGSPRKTTSSGRHSGGSSTPRV